MKIRKHAAIRQQTASTAFVTRENVRDGIKKNSKINKNKNNK